MAGNSKSWKKRVRLALMILLGLDAMLLVAVWRTGAAPEALREEHARLQQQHNLLSADVGKAAQIRERLPQVRQDCQRFLAERFLSTAGGQGKVLADLTAIFRRTSLTLSSVRFREREEQEQGIIELVIEASVEGDYPGLVRFVNGLERSENFYLMEGLTLAETTAGRIKLNLELKTYLRPT